MVLRNVEETTSYRLPPGVQTARHETMDKMEETGLLNENLKWILFSSLALPPCLVILC